MASERPADDAEHAKRHQDDQGGAAAATAIPAAVTGTLGGALASQSARL